MGLIKFDVHVDNRIPGEKGVSSGTCFCQIIQEMEQDNQRLHYLAIGVQRSGNTKELFERANKTGSTYLLDKELYIYTNESSKQTIESFCDDVDGYLSRHG